MTENCASLLVAMSLLPHLKKLQVELQQDYEDVEAGLPLLLASVRAQTDLQELCVRPKLVHQDVDDPEAMDLSPLAHLHSLTSLYFHWRVQPAGLEALCRAKGPSLRRLEIEVSLSDTDLHTLSCLKQLNHIHLYGRSARLPADSLVHCFSALLALSSVHLHSLVGITSLGLGSSQHTNLEKLVLGDLPDVHSLPARSYCFPKLRSIKVMTDIGLAPQTQLNDLLAPLTKPGSTMVSRSLQSLSVRQMRMSFPSISTVLTSLTRLILHGGEFDHLPAELSNLKQLQELRLLSCPALHVTTSLIMNLPVLRSLAVHHCAKSNLAQSLSSLIGSHSNLHTVSLDPFPSWSLRRWE